MNKVGYLIGGDSFTDFLETLEKVAFEEPTEKEIEEASSLTVDFGDYGKNGTWKVIINGNPYMYKVAKAVYTKVISLAKHNRGRALAFLKKNSKLLSGSLKKENLDENHNICEKDLTKAEIAVKVRKYMDNLVASIMQKASAAQIDLHPVDQLDLDDRTIKKLQLIVDKLDKTADEIASIWKKIAPKFK